MSEDTEVVQPSVDTTPAPVETYNPWKFVPLLYVMQAIPVTIISELSTVFYKDLGIPNEQIATWTSIIALPWSLQFLLGPLVDLSAQKRKWILLGQLILTACLALAPFLLLPGQKAFTVSLIFLGGTAFVSAMTNIATDGFYLLAFPKTVQASFAGIQTACYRAGRLICMALVPFLVGYFMRFNPVTVQTQGNLYFSVKGPADKSPSYLKTATFHLDQGELTTDQGQKLLDDKGVPVAIPGVENQFNIQNGKLEVAGKQVTLGLYQLGKVISDKPSDSTAKLTSYPTGDPTDSFTGQPATRAMSAPTAWFISLFAVAVLYALLMVPARFLLPAPSQDKSPDEAQLGQFRGNLNRTLAILGFYATAYFALSGTWKIAANTLASLNPVALKGWLLPVKAMAFGIDVHMSGLTAEIIQVLVCIPIAVVLVIILRKSLRGTAMGEAFSSFFRQSGVIPILGFLTFYRFSEAMVAKMSALFLKDDLAKGGLALNNAQFGFIKGTIGVGGIILGGIVGGVLASKIGLKRGFWVIAILMHLPIFLYLYAAMAQPSNMGFIGFVEFMDQFGYGLGYAGYAVYLMSVAQRGNHRTAHYAIGTGLGATFIALSGIIGGVIQASSEGYRTVFLAALLFAIPGLLTLNFIPHDETAS
ncbi:MAG: hypothetical protein JST12_01275 [Armatimonadetes bacterium]|nr:hypothetical protein [Armatimonadota bacterium]